MKPEEAIEQITYLRDLLDRSRLRAAGGYPHFLFWGVLWVVGYLGTLWLPVPLGRWVWPAIYVVGAAGSTLIGIRTAHATPVPALLKKLGWLTVIFSVASLGLLILFVGMSDRHTINAYWPFVIGVMYATNSLFLGRELMLIGVWLVVTAVASLWMASPIQDIWLAMAGGGGLILTGILLRRQVAQR